MIKKVPILLTDWDLDIGVSLDTLKKPKGVFQGCCPINDNCGILLSKIPRTKNSKFQKNKNKNFYPGGSLLNLTTSP